jgi:hypothetical protein
MAKKLNKLLLSMSVIFLLGSSCETDKPPVNYTSIEGIYTCQETSAHSGVREYIVEVDRVKDHETLYIISNFHNKGENEFLFAELAQDTLIIFNQAISNLSVNGKGSIGHDFKSIHLLYETDDGIIALDYMASYTR